MNTNLNTETLIDMAIERGIINISDDWYHVLPEVTVSGRSNLINLVNTETHIKEYLEEKLAIDQTELRNLRSLVSFLEVQLDHRQQLTEQY